MTLSFTEAAADRIVQREIVAGVPQSYANVGVIYNADAGMAVDVDVVNYGTTTEVVAWQAINTTGMPAGVFVVQVPVGGWYTLRMRDHANPSVVVTSAVKFCVGAVFDMLGQSNMQNLWATSSFPPTPDPLTRTFVGGAWSSAVGNGIIALGNALRAGLGIPIGFICSAVGGSALCAPSAGAAGFWLDTSPGSPWQLFQAANAASWCQGAESLMWDQGEQDETATGYFSYLDFQKYFWEEYRAYRSAGGRYSQNIFIGGLGNWTAQPSDSVQRIRSAQAGGVALGAMKMLCSRHDLPMSDGVHLTVPSGYVSYARRLAQGILYNYGAATKSACGPAVFGVTRSGSTLTVQFALAPGATTIAQASPGIPANWRFSADGFANLLTPTSFSTTDATHAQFGFGASLPANLWVDYGFGNCAADAHIITDDVFPQSDSLACPVRPMVSPLSA